MFSEILKNSQENTCARVSFLIKLQTEACNYIKKDSGTDVFLWILRKFYGDLFYKTSATANVFRGNRNGTLVENRLNWTTFENHKFSWSFQRFVLKKRYIYSRPNLSDKKTSDKIFRRTKFSSSMENFVTFVRRKFCPLLKFLTHVFFCHFFHKMG